MRVTGGELRGRPLQTTRDHATRPTAARARAGLFDWLGPRVRGARVLDLFAGSGALGIEALSRGARSAVFVERARPALAALARNLEALDLRPRSRVIGSPARQALGRLAREGARFDLILADPPWGAGWPRTGPDRRTLPDVVAPGGILVIERDRRAEPWAGTSDLLECGSRAYGETTFDRYAESEEGSVMTEPGSAVDRLAVYPASFDPITNGHVDIIERASHLFDHLVVAVAKNVAKQGMFSLEDRIEMIQTAIGDLPNISIDTISGLLVDYAREKGASVVIRGLRAMADFEYEFEMAMMNSHMNPDVETVFLMTSPKWFYVSSSRLRELVQFGADIDDFVPKLVAERLKLRLGDPSSGG